MGLFHQRHFDMLQKEETCVYDHIQGPGVVLAGSQSRHLNEAEPRLMLPVPVLILVKNVSVLKRLH